MCLMAPEGESPMIIYREREMHPSVLDDTLKKAWRQCGLPTPDPPCSYKKDMGNKPPPQSGSLEGHKLKEVIVNSGGQPVSGARVTVNGSFIQGDPFSAGKFTNDEGLATFFLPSFLEKGMRVDVKGPPGFSNASFVVGGFILDTRLMIELSPTED